jgi:hypothetical protein
VGDAMSDGEAGRAMDAEIARRVLGYVVDQRCGPMGDGSGMFGFWRTIRRPGEGDEVREPLPAYSTEIGAAWQVVAHLMERGMDYSFGSGSWPDGTRYHVARFFRQDSSRAYLGDTPGLPLAICRAALMWADGRETVRTGGEGGE